MRSMEWIQSIGVIPHGNIYLWLVAKKSSVSRSKFYVFSDSVLCRGKMSENPLSNNVWQENLTWFKSSSQSRTLDTIDGEPREFEWNICPGFTTLQLCYKSPRVHVKKENGTEFRSWWCLNSAKADTQSSDPQVHYLEECSKAKVVENY